MPKWRTKYEDGRKYCASWEKSFPWCRNESTTSSNAFCKLCSVSIQPKLSSLKKHETSDGHKARASKSQPAVETVLGLNRSSRNLASIKDVTKCAEIELSVNIACHGAIRSVDHLCEFFTKHGQGSTLGNLKLHRTKCAQVIRKVVSPEMKKDLLEDLKDKPYALLVDESTDVGSIKLLCVCVRYMSPKNNAITTAFLSLLPVVDATANSLFNTIQQDLVLCGISLSKCIGFASDGASTMVGEHNSIWSRLKKESPNCIQMKCMCHSLALCIQNAFSKLPSNIGFLLSEIPNWFSNSTQRRDAFVSLFKVMSETDDPDLIRPVSCLPFEKLSTTRWLVRGKVLYNILINWEELKAYFTCAELSQTRPDTRYKARLVKEMLNDPCNYLYFVFATPIVQEFERVNALFQSTKADPHTLTQELNIHQQSLHARLYKPDGCEKSLDEIDFGAKFQQECMNQEGQGQIKQRCRDVLVEALQQVKKRTPPVKDAFKSLCLLSPNCVLNQTTKGQFSDLPFQHLLPPAAEEQYRKINYVDWKNEEAFKDTGIPLDSEKFWLGVMQHGFYNDLAMYALCCLSTPVSNACVERIFSLVTAIKTKPRNKLETQLLGAIVRIRSSLMLEGKCCLTFQATPRMIAAHNSFSLYDYQGASNNPPHEASTSQDEVIEVQHDVEDESDEASLMLLAV